MNKSVARKNDKKTVLSIFDPERKGTDETSVLGRLRPEFLELRDNPSPRRRLADKLFELRRAAGLSQAGVAKRAKVGLATYQRIEQCQPSANPEMDVLEKLAGAFGVDISEFWSKPTLG